VGKEYLVHKAVEVKNCAVAVKKKLSVIGYLEDNYRAFAKYDGCCTVVTIEDDGTVSYHSRTGETANLHHLDPAIRKVFGETAKLNRGIVVFAEAWWPGKDQFPEISGAFRRHAGDTRLQLAVWDAVTLDEFKAGVCTRPFSTRWGGVLASFGGDHKAVPHHTNMVFPAAEFVAYSTAQYMCGLLMTTGGYDGLMMRDPQGEWRRNDSGKQGESIKVKARDSIEVRITGQREGEGKQAGMMGALTFQYKGKTCEVGTGFTDEQRKWFWSKQVEVNNGNFIVEVECLGFTPADIPREPSFKGIRHDKLSADNE